jgi:hypothetical protein
MIEVTIYLKPFLVMIVVNLNTAYSLEVNRY